VEPAGLPAAGQRGTGKTQYRAQIERDEAILAAYALLQDLCDHPIFDWPQSAAGAGGTLITRLSLVANSDEAVNVQSQARRISLGRISVSQTKTKQVPAQSRWDGLRLKVA
jgi:hypothetical protein